MGYVSIFAICLLLCSLEKYRACFTCFIRINSKFMITFYYIHTHIRWFHGPLSGKESEQLLKEQGEIMC